MTSDEFNSAIVMFKRRLGYQNEMVAEFRVGEVMTYSPTYKEQIAADAADMYFDGKLRSIIAFRVYGDIAEKLKMLRHSMVRDPLFYSDAVIAELNTIIDSIPGERKAT